MTVTPFEHTLIGAMSGSFEVCMMQPTVAIKNAMQEGRPIPKNILHLYRGLPMNVVSMAPITASQFGVNRLFSQSVLGKSESQLTSVERFGSAAVAGAASGLIASPSELIIIHQQKTGMSLANQASQIFQTHGIATITRGVLPTMCRETLYAAGYLGLFPVLKQVLDENYSEVMSPGTTLAVAGITGGFFGAICSHPFDTAKTKMQANMYAKPEYMTLRSTLYNIYMFEGGLRRLWSGMMPRMARIIAATFILNGVKNISVDYLEEQRK